MHKEVLEEIHVFVKESQSKDRRSAYKRVLTSFRDGTLPKEEEIAHSRGLVIRERANSIFSDAWIPIAVLITFIGFVANRNAEIMSVGIGLIVMALVSYWWKQAALIGVTYARSFDRSHVFPGEPVQMKIEINNRKFLPLTWLQFKDEVPTAPTEKGELALIASQVAGSYSLHTALSMHGNESKTRVATFKFPKRGYYKFGPVKYTSGDIFTLFTIEREYRYLENLIVYPDVWPLEALELPAKEMFGDISVFRSLFTDPVNTQGIRSYQPQDRFRDIHWKVSARRGELQTKVYEPTSGMSIVAFLNVATMERHWMGYDPGLLERAVSVTASILSFGSENRWGIGVFANGTIPGSDQPLRVPVGRSPNQLVRILEALAAVTEFATGSIETLIHRESSKLPWATTIVLITAIVTKEMLATLTRLQEAGRKIVLISLADESPPRDSPNLNIFHVPSSVSVFKSEPYAQSITEKSLGSIPGIDEVALLPDEQ